MSPLVVAGIFSSITLALTALFLVERARGTRYLPRFRALLDEVFERGKGEVLEKVPAINREFFLHTFHYVIHKALFFVLRALARIEKGLHAVVRLNRTKAKERISRLNPDSHLQKIAEHKEEMALSETEKQAWKDAALQGGAIAGPPTSRAVKRSKKMETTTVQGSEESSPEQPFV